MDDSKDDEAQTAPDLVLLAMAEPEAEQAAFIEANAESPALAKEALALLLAGKDAEGFFNRLSDRLGIADSEALDAQEQTFQQQQFGSYKTSKLIGRGGMGAVYLASRSDNQFDQVVALKTLPPLFQSDVLQARFLQERQILARLNHPNIARLLDGGVADDATPFIAMEYVDGLPITSYCDHHQLTLAKRLELFLQVCAGVEYAHSNLVVHRDLKPQNILVSGEGNVKLLDFGIAKLIDGEENNGLTQNASQPMTLRYASPEVLEGQPANTMSDVYSLGVLLFEIITGISPYAQSLSSEAELRRMVLTGDFSPPPLALKAIDVDTRELVASQRQIGIEKLSQQLTGELSDVVMASLRHTPATRYSSVREFADDIRNYLANRPVNARRASTWYVVSKFYRRNRLGVIAATLAVLSLAAVTTVATLYGLENARQTVEIRKEKDRAEQIQAFLLSIFSLSSPNETKGRSVDLKELLDIGAERVEKELANQPLAASELKRSIARLYAQLGLPADSEPLIREALEQQHIQFLNDPQKGTGYIETLEQLSEVIEMSGRYGEALEVSSRALALAQQANDQTTVALTSLRVARLLHLQGKLVEARPHYERTLRTQRAIFGPTSKELIATSMHYGSYLRHIGSNDEAIEYLSTAAEQSLLQNGELHLMTMSGYVNLGGALNAAQRHGEAETALRKSLAITEKLLGADHPDKRYSLSHLSEAMIGQGQFRAGNEFANELRALVEETLGIEHPEYPITLNQVGKALSAAGQPVEALRYLQEAEEGYERYLPNSHRRPKVAIQIAKIYRELGNLNAAKEKIDRVLSDLGTVAAGSDPEREGTIRDARREQKLIDTAKHPR